jgi:hypothetical protein
MMRLKIASIRNLAVFIIVFATLLGLCFDFYSDAIGGRVSMGYIRDGRYFVGSDGGVKEIQASTWSQALVFETLFRIVFVLALLSAGFILVWFVFLRDCF